MHRGIAPAAVDTVHDFHQRVLITRGNGLGKQQLLLPQLGGCQIQQRHARLGHLVARLVDGMQAGHGGAHQYLGVRRGRLQRDGRRLVKTRPWPKR